MSVTYWALFVVFGAAYIGLVCMAIAHMHHQVCGVMTHSTLNHICWTPEVSFLPLTDTSLVFLTHEQHSTWDH
jgi:hypothetical protein